MWAAHKRKLLKRSHVEPPCAPSLFLYTHYKDSSLHHSRLGIFEASARVVRGVLSSLQAARKERKSSLIKLI